MGISKIEREIIDKKFDNPNAEVKCPRCEKPLLFIDAETAWQVKCENCEEIKVTLRGF